ncbi:MAG TPA: hypothetical protein VMT88_13550 [Actinomycetes bacterium]|nr:hypothetical protein [Actinomycetes bacterium]
MKVLIHAFDIKPTRGCVSTTVTLREDLPTQLPRSVALGIGQLDAPAEHGDITK